MGGLNQIDRLRHGGVDCSKVTFGRARPAEFHFPDKDHPLWHPRGEYPPDPEMAADIAARGVTDPILVFEEVLKGGARRLIPINGSQRIINALEAERLNPGLEVKIEFHLYDGGDAKNDAERTRNALRERALRNLDPHRKPDSPSALAHMARAMQRVGMEQADILPVMPRHVTPTILDGLLRWPHLSEKAASAIDSGKVPLRQIGALLDLAPADQDVAVESGVAPKRQRAEKPRRPHPKALEKACKVLSGYTASQSPHVSQAARLFEAGIRFASGDVNALRVLPDGSDMAKDIASAIEKKRKEASHGA